MELEVSKSVIKVEPIPEDDLFYQKGDLVLGKCINNPPWPAVVRCFRGYDQDEVQVFTVDFIGSPPSSAQLQTYCMSPLGPQKIRKLLKKADPQLSRALTKAEQIFKCLNEKRHQQAKFRSLYFGWQRGSREQEDVDVPKRMSTQERQFPRPRRSGCAIQKQADVSVWVQTQADNLVLIQMSMNNTYCTTYHPKMKFDPVKMGEIQVDIRDWGQQKAQHNQKAAQYRRPFTRSQAVVRTSKHSSANNLSLITASSL